MRRAFVLILLALLLGVGVVAVIETDPGYVLVAYGNYTLETSLWVGLLLLLALVLLLYFTVRLLRKLISGQHSVAHWLGARKSRQAARLTNRGLIAFIEGNWHKARRLLLRGASHNEAPLINYLVAARASYRLGDSDRMREYLGAAERSDAEAGIAVELTQAEMKLDAGQYEQAAATLVRARRNAAKHPHVLKLLCQAYRGLEDWDNLAALLPDLAKHKVMSQAELESLERTVHLRRLQYSATRDDNAADALYERWQSLPPQWKRDRDLLRAYVALLITQDAHGAAEKVCLRALKQDWDSELARLYAFVHSDNPSKQLTQAEGWLAEHREDAQLLLSLGRLSARNELWGKARDYMEASYQLRHTPEVCAELGRLLGALGEPTVSARYFEEGLLRDVKLPELPMPERAAPKRLTAGS
ncbi:heme biosynthesis HemY N-terminal domain-containing protein [Parahaliea aestuarii]|uniref:Heme biosynthesis protein HemY n=1 Tax=Parahaliea aestuarii TaxID=1852021 RepID=A0A5C8ZSF9_9GAMM|nr:heme biosynthesis HemY N-terminal domain-containing protein [Parahaliea aestuarii]TXS90522.1 heme biosynthesis protein HemY [Parahaliea aestuarii]